MAWKSKAVTFLKDSLTDPLCGKTLLQLEMLNDRILRDGSIENRIKDKDGNPISDIADLAGLIEEQECIFSVPASVSTDTLAISITPKTFYVELNKFRREDEEPRLDYMFYGKRWITFTLMYYNDGSDKLRLVYITTRDIIEDGNEDQ